MGSSFGRWLRQSNTWIRCLLRVVPLLCASPITAANVGLDAVIDQAERLEQLDTLLIAKQGTLIVDHGFRGHRTTAPTNIKSASKTVIAALTGIALERHIIESVDQPIIELLATDAPKAADPRLRQITVGHLLSMQAGLESTSGRNYGAWVTSGNWVRAALARPFEGEPGGAMIYSTGSSHLLSAILTRRTGQSTLQLARQWLAPLDDFHISAWSRDPQGIYLGGNEMAMTPRSLLAFGELFRRGGLTASGERLLAKEWIEASWTPRTRSRYTGDGYGYGWFITRLAGEEVRYGWGYGGQMLYVVPGLQLTVVMTSDTQQPSSGALGHRQALHRLLGSIIEAVREPASSDSTP